MSFNNKENSLSLAYYIRKVNNPSTRAAAIKKANELEERLDLLLKENKELKLAAKLK